MIGDIERATAASKDLAKRPLAASSATFEEDDERYLQAVGRAKEYIAAGDVYQANLSRGWITPSSIAAEGYAGVSYVQAVRLELIEGPPPELGPNKEIEPTRDMATTHP